VITVQAYHAIQISVSTLHWLVAPWRDARERQRLVSVLGALEAFVDRVGPKG
jgi:hypothetical protein